MTHSLHRRRFLGRTLAIAGAAVLAPRVLAAGMDHDMHAGHAMPEQAPAQPALRIAPADLPLLPADALPTGQPLLPLHRIGERDGAVLRLALTAAPHTVQLLPSVKTEFWSYNGSTPGPLIEAMEGDTLEIRFRNDLPQATTVHWHGLPVPADQDGGPHHPVAPGEERLYRLELPKGSAGTYWYHPHPHGDTPEQVFRGLAGALIVRTADDPLAALPEQHLFISDLRLAADGSIPFNNVDDWMDGREGQFVLVNGQLQPQLTVNGAQRWRIWNACSARYLRLKLAGAQWQLVGTDGGLLEQARPLGELVLAPAERIEVVVSGSGAVRLLALPYDRQKMGDAPPERERVLARATFSAGPRVQLPARLRSIADPGLARATKRVVFSETMSMENGQHSMAFLINGKAYDMNRADWHSKAGEVELWEVINDSHMDHPFHLHGTQFMVVERKRGGKVVREPFKAWRDTVNLRPNERLLLKLRFPHPGMYMAHCHIIEHEAQGMMAQVQVS
ncbi:bilirubin oxidase [Andreprevotia lacus DSM 23236]|jgi:bilirubin oxidase|uniref:Bilirubin oxidase n=1 Tax=Andreprevotia lacus DSM 23236 TaxID=1121001 RepID=A0A1W1WYR7_9NEIS|nr:multicopper oxidase family protein [Andreprevotia lacus]SMC16690.1 bilirubin oxidase [Andreprevotia lacus DSM 23236]